MTFFCLLCSPAIIGIPLPLGKMIAAEIALVNNFIWNEAWTFNDLKHERSIGLELFDRFFRFQIICFVGIILGIIAIKFLHSAVGLNLFYANICAIGIATSWNYLLNYYLNWGVRKR